MGSHGHRVDFDAAHDWVFIRNAIQSVVLQLLKAAGW